MTAFKSFDAAAFTPPTVASGSKGYVYPDGLARAVKVALATERPLLLRGAPGSGKTTLARSIAETLGADYYQEVVTSRTEARDLEWRFDALQRLADAQVPARHARLEAPANYVEPRALWWAFAPDRARTRGGVADSAPKDPVPGLSSVERGAVVLIDEIDKAEPEVANDLLEPLDVGSFTVAETGTPIKPERAVLVVITTNEERDLPQAFLRRCVVFALPAPDTMLERVAASHFGLPADDPDLVALRTQFLALTAEAGKRGLRAPNLAEFLDGLRAVKALGAGDADTRAAIARLAMWKHADEARG